MGGLLLLLSGLLSELQRRRLGLKRGGMSDHARCQTGRGLRDGRRRLLEKKALRL
jgi:hypothetical protein